MRLKESIVISAPSRMVWDYIADPANALHYMSGITRWEVVGERPIGLGARYRMLIKVGSAEVGGLIEIVEFNDEPENTIAREMAHKHMRAAVNRLPRRQREVLLLHVNEGLTYKQIAERQGLTYRVILRDLTRAYSQLRVQLKHDELGDMENR